jgi:hypothetical protein
MAVKPVISAGFGAMLVIMCVLTGSANTLLTKLADITSAMGVDGTGTIIPSVLVSALCSAVRAFICFKQMVLLNLIYLCMVSVAIVLYVSNGVNFAATVRHCAPLRAPLLSNSGYVLRGVLVLHCGMSILFISAYIPQSILYLPSRVCLVLTLSIGRVFGKRRNPWTPRTAP